MKAALINFANPYGYVFWLAIGIPLVHSSLKFGFGAAVFVVLVYYFALLLMKVALVVVTTVGGKYLANRGMKYVMNALGFVLIAISCYLFLQSIHFFGLNTI